MEDLGLKSQILQRQARNSVLEDFNYFKQLVENRGSVVRVTSWKNVLLIFSICMKSYGMALVLVNADMSIQTP
jgi:hypothetical protein